eukprot:SAG31_NODE_1038_length_10218_cov_16.418223_12_plen_150_part_00
MRNVSLNLEHPITDPDAHRAHLFAFGSYALGVNARDADIDTVCIVPAHIEGYRDFFGMRTPTQYAPTFATLDGGMILRLWLGPAGKEDPAKPGTGEVWLDSGKPECALYYVVRVEMPLFSCPFSKTSYMTASNVPVTDQAHAAVSPLSL